MPDFSVRAVSWREAGTALAAIRTEVFIREQRVPADLEWDDLDEDAMHLLATDTKGDAIACARITDGRKIGRMAVLMHRRGEGVGMTLLHAAVAHCRAGLCTNISLSAQTYALGFYEKAGFVVCSDEYMDAGIPHHDMILVLNY